MSKEGAKEKRQDLPEVKPSSDIIQKNDGFYIFIDMPGAGKEDLNIEMDNNTLSVDAYTSYPLEKGHSVIVNEFGNVRYSRKFTLSDEVDKEGITANMTNGLLKLYIPKAKELQPRKIEIEQT
ncbi:MAG: Hsp20/alpha crystallin family protein [Desulfohalobiaceae bacterium]|nr:Hsp20/alpha crystallin family protein [Desulfohalobiaceae bacterium]